MVEKVRHRRSRCLKSSTYFGVRLGLLAACGLDERAFLNPLPSSCCFVGLSRDSRIFKFFGFFKSRINRIFSPTCYLEVSRPLTTLGFHKGLGQLNMGDHGYGQIHRLPRNQIIFSQFWFLIILRDVFHQIYLALPKIYGHIETLFFGWPAQTCTKNQFCQ